MAFTEDLLLPSRGIIYLLPSFDGYVKVKPFTTKAYKSLLAGNANDNAIRQFADTCLVDCPVKAKDMCDEDLLAILFKSRIMTLGNTLKTEVRCPRCNKLQDVNWDLSELDVNYLFADEYPIKLTLPASNTVIKLRYPTGADTRKAKIEAEKRASKFNMQTNEFTNTFLTVSTIDVEYKDIVEKAEWYEALNPQDSIYIDEAISTMKDLFGIQLTKEIKCTNCDREFSTIIDLSSDFFRTSRPVITSLTSKTGNMASAFAKPNVSEQKHEDIN